MSRRADDRGPRESGPRESGPRESGPRESGPTGTQAFDAAVRAAVDAALDAGRDPLGDEAVLAALVEAPEAFEHVVRLTGDADGLARHAPCVPALRGRRRLAAGPIAAVAAVALIAAGIALALAPDRSARDVPHGDPIASTSDSRDADSRDADPRDADPGAADPPLQLAAVDRTPASSVVESLTFTSTSGPPEARETIALTRRAGSQHTTLIRTVRGLSPAGDAVHLTFEERLP